MNPQAAESNGALNAAFAVLADPTQRAMLERLAQGETSVGDLVRPFAISAPAISRHLRVLENAQLMERRVDAQWRICRLNPSGLRAADDWLERDREFWEHSLDCLAEVLELPLPAFAGGTGACVGASSSGSSMVTSIGIGLSRASAGGQSNITARLKGGVDSEHLLLLGLFGFCSASEFVGRREVVVVDARAFGFAISRAKLVPGG